MHAELDHLLIPAKDRVAAARLIARLFDVPWAEQGSVGPFSPVYVSSTLTLDFDQWSDPVPKLHYAFRVTQVEFDAILSRIKAMGLAFRSSPIGPDDHQVNTAFGGNLVYWSEPDGHAWELLTVSYERRGFTSKTGVEAPDPSNGRTSTSTRRALAAARHVKR
jgi:hypothetical protein